MDNISAAHTCCQGVRDIALSFVARLDIGPEAQSVVMDALGDDRIRTAMYSVRKTLTKMRAEGALQLLRSVPMTKVTGMARAQV